MKKYFLSIFLVFFILSCTHWTIDDEIYPKVTESGGDLLITYTLGNLTVNDNLRDLDPKVYKYIIYNKESIRFTLKVEYDEAVNNQFAYFYYYINGIYVAKNKDVVKTEILLMERDSFSKFKCIGGSCSSYKNSIDKIEKEEDKQPEKTSPPVKEVENKQLKEKDNKL